MAGVLSSIVYDVGTFTATGNGASAQVDGNFNIAVWGTFVGTVVLERSFDGGTTWIPRMWEFTQTNVSLTSQTSGVMSEPELGVLYRFRCSAFTSGTINYRISK